jgi:hypothetical protein
MSLINFHVDLVSIMGIMFVLSVKLVYYTIFYDGRRIIGIGRSIQDIMLIKSKMSLRSTNLTMCLRLFSIKALLKTF